MKEKSGKTTIILEENNGETKINTIYYEGISKVSPTIYLDAEKVPCYFLIHIGGGYIEGEHTSTHIELKEHARSIISTQTPTIVYKCPNGICSKQDITIQLADNSILEYIVDNTILFKDAVYEQNTDIHITSKSTLIYTDGITAGWSEDNKKYQYTSLNIRNKIIMDSKTIVLDNLYIQPKKQNVSALGIFENYNNYATVLLIDPRIDHDFLLRLRTLLSTIELDVRYGLSSLEVPGIAIRILGNYTQDIQEIIYTAVNFMRQTLLDSGTLDLRKQ